MRSAFNGDAFLFVSEDGTVSGWRGALGTTAENLQLASDAVYKGVALSTIGGNTYLFAANFHSGAIDVLKGNAGCARPRREIHRPRSACRLCALQHPGAGGQDLRQLRLQGSGKDEQARAGSGLRERV